MTNTCFRYRFKADKPPETTEEVEFKKQQAMQEHLKQMTRQAGWLGTLLSFFQTSKHAPGTGA